MNHPTLKTPQMTLTAREWGFVVAWFGTIAAFCLAPSATLFGTILNAYGLLLAAFSSFCILWAQFRKPSTNH